MSRLFDGKIECQWPAACMAIERHFITAMSITCADHGDYPGPYSRPPKLWVAKIEVERTDNPKLKEELVGEGPTLAEALADAERLAQAFNQEHRVPD